MKRVIYILAIILLSANFSHAQELNDSTNNWHFRISPYFWFVGFKGTIYRPPTPSNYPYIAPPSYDIDISFRELSSSLKFAMMLAGEYRTKHTVTIFNYASVILDGEAVTPLDFLLQNVQVHLDYHSGDISTGYRFVKSDKWEIDGMIGLKFIYFNIEGRTNVVGTVSFDGNRSNLWIDPLFGARVIYYPIKKIEIMSYGDIGGFLFGSELSNQFIGGVTYLFTKSFVTTLGYRYWGIQVDAEEAIYSGHIKGWIVRIGFQF